LRQNQAHPFPRQLDACLSLLRRAKSKLSEGSRRRDRLDEVVLIEIVRALNTCEAIVALAIDGYGPQGEMLLRPMFEAVVTGWWASQHPEETVGRYDLQGRYLLSLWATSQREAGLYGEVDMPDPLTEAELAEAIRLL